MSRDLLIDVGDEVEMHDGRRGVVLEVSELSFVVAFERGGMGDVPRNLISEVRKKPDMRQHI